MLDLAIIGGGPAGLTAGLYATRGGLANVVMFEMGMPGGQITGSSEIENYPGQGAVMTGMDLMASWPEQCQKFGLKHEMAQVETITKNGLFIHQFTRSTPICIKIDENLFWIGFLSS